jgi:hypothetical protein
MIDSHLHTFTASYLAYCSEMLYYFQLKAQLQQPFILQATHRQYYGPLDFAAIADPEWEGLRYGSPAN